MNLDVEHNARGEKCVHGFCCHGTSSIFNKCVTNSDAAKYRGPLDLEVMENQDQQKKKIMLNAVLRYGMTSSPWYTQWMG